MKQQSLFDDQRLTMQDSIELTAQSINAYGCDYRHWAIAFSGGKDSTAVLIEAHTWPQGWSGDEVAGDVLLPEVISEGVIQSILFPN